ncbi:MAG: hypothetical protein K0B07_01630 [DPANN group archaeon]|nr:hypothetical protein [DPANN group archaeon]
MPKQKKPWSKKTKYTPLKTSQIKKQFKDQIHTIPPKSTFKHIIQEFVKTGNTHTLNLENCVLLPKHPAEVLSYKHHGNPQTDTEHINYSDETDWNIYGNFWEISLNDFQAKKSNLMKPIYPYSLHKRKEFMNRVKKRKVDQDIQFEPRFRYDALKQDWSPWTKHEATYNLWDYVTAIKSGAKFYTEHTNGNHLEFENIDINVWFAEVPADSNPEKTYTTTIEYIKGKQPILQHFIGDCTCPDHKKRSTENRNRICKHIFYAMYELACHSDRLPETFPFPKLSAFHLNEKLDNLIYPESKRTDTSKDTILRAYIDYKINDITTLFTTDPIYAQRLHTAYKDITT